METDSFFYQLLKATPPEKTRSSDRTARPNGRRSLSFDSVEVKKSFRIDVLFLPRASDLPFVRGVSALSTGSPNFFFLWRIYFQGVSPEETTPPGLASGAIFASRRTEAEVNWDPMRVCCDGSRDAHFNLTSLPCPRPAAGSWQILHLVTAPAKSAGAGYRADPQRLKMRSVIAKWESL